MDNPLPIQATAPEVRPPIEDVHSAWELKRWYWTKAELVMWARHLGVRSSGSKSEVIEAIASKLDGISQAARGSRQSDKRQTQLSGELTADTIIPEGQRSSQVLRQFFEQHIGSHFRFDKAMRDFIASGAGRTLQEAIDYWYATRQPNGQTEIDSQFEYNRFTREWYVAHPGATRAEVGQAWKEYRQSPRY